MELKTVRLTNNEGVIAWEVVDWNLQVQWSGTLSDTARDIVVRAVAGAEPAAKVASFANWNTSKVGANAYIYVRQDNFKLRAESKIIGLLTQHDKPFGVFDTVRIWLGVSKVFPLGLLGFLNFTGSSVTDENGLSSPFDDYLTSWREYEGA